MICTLLRFLFLLCLSSLSVSVSVSLHLCVRTGSSKFQFWKTKGTIFCVQNS